VCHVELRSAVAADRPRWLGLWQPRAPWCDGCIRLEAHAALGQTASGSIVFVEPSGVSEGWRSNQSKVQGNIGRRSGVSENPVAPSLVKQGIDKNLAHRASVGRCNHADVPRLDRTAPLIVPHELPGDLAGKGEILLDPRSELHHRYGARSECLYVVRPDGYIGFRSQPPDPVALKSYLTQIFLWRGEENVAGSRRDVLEVHERTHALQ
jgi:hypothetical protein